MNAKELVEQIQKVPHWEEMDIRICRINEEYSHSASDIAVHSSAAISYKFKPSIVIYSKD